MASLAVSSPTWHPTVPAISRSLYGSFVLLPYRSSGWEITRNAENLFKRRRQIISVRSNASQPETKVEEASLSDPDGCIPTEEPPSEHNKRSGSSPLTLWRRFLEVAAPYWSSEDKGQARLRLFAVFVLTLGTTGMSVLFNFLGRDFYNAIANKDEEVFIQQVIYYTAAIAAAVPVFVLRDYARDTLALRWRAWLTSQYMKRYFADRVFYTVQSQSLIDNPDQRLVDDLNSFTATALGFALALFNAAIDLASFSGILYGIYPPLFGVLVVYSVGGTAVSVALGKDLVSLNFLQEKREADFRYGLVRVRENAESIAFYSGQLAEIQILLHTFKQSFQNYLQLLTSSRNLQFFTSGYRYLIQLLPAVVVAPLYFRGEIEFGVINQSFSAFNHVLTDFSIIVYQFQAISSFSATIERLGEFNDLLDSLAVKSETAQQGEPPEQSQKPTISLVDVQAPESGSASGNGLLGTPVVSRKVPLLDIEDLTVYTPQYGTQLVRNLSMRIFQGDHLLIMGASGAGKTSFLRVVAGLWKSGKGKVTRFVDLPEVSQAFGEELVQQQAGEGAGSVETLDEGGSIFFVPQKPYMVLGTLRQQLLYPTWNRRIVTADSGDMNGFPIIASDGGGPFTAHGSMVVTHLPPPTDSELMDALEKVKLGQLLKRCDGLESRLDWSSVLSLGEQQRLAFARLLLSKPRLALMDEATSALDEENEAYLYKEVEATGVTFISVGHRSTLKQFHAQALYLQPNSNPNWRIERL